MDTKMAAMLDEPQTRNEPRNNDGPDGPTNGAAGVGAADEFQSSLSLLRSAVAEVKELTSLLAATQRRATWSRTKVEVLVETASRLRVKLVRLTTLVKHTRHDSVHDELTGLPNRALLLDRFRQARAIALRDNKQIAMLMIDLDGFKGVNDAFGHGTGDNLLQHVAWLLSTCIRGGDTACRYGGDEFVIMLPRIEGMECARTVAQKIRARLAASFFVEGGLIPVTASIGVALFPDDGKDCDSLLRIADMRMYEEKAHVHTVRTFGAREMRA